MNTLRSVGYGWGVLILAGGGAYYFAKKSINADRAERAAAERERRARWEDVEYNNPSPARMNQPATQYSPSSVSQGGKNKPPSGDVTGDPAKEASQDPAPSGEKGYQATEPWRSKKGDRFS
ncbi:hypothetical protein M501DRAFT_1000372 [Patellaria atrata CBS 101060]|uniref:Uncharacterized protein n=1 Tax=Patellaria atrata CBS 101060 TaxID=1346257 RepID=A0A9P4SG98_9PEZI|nr:hypothetical protein M501DRAFT_1000372 [Patellaria atrata CBS 101060]